MFVDDMQMYESVSVCGSSHYVNSPSRCRAHSDSDKVHRARRRRNTEPNKDVADNPLAGDPMSLRKKGDALKITGYRVESSDKHLNLDDMNVPQLLTGSWATLRLFGTGFTDHTTIIFTEEHHDFGGPCQVTNTESFLVDKESLAPGTVLVRIRAPKTSNYLFFCAREAEIIANVKVRSE